MLKKNLNNLVVVFFLLSFLGSNILSAAIISPPLLDLSTTSRFASGQVLKPGDRYEGYFEVIFRETDPEILYISVKKLDIEDNTGEPIVSDVRSMERDTLDKWITLKNTTVTKPPGTGTEGCNGCNFVRINYTIDIPDGTQGGAYFAGILVSTAPPSLSGGQSGVSIGEELVYQVFINLASDDIRYDTKILSFDTVNSQRFFSSMPVNFVTTLQNDGDSFIVPKGFIYISAGGVRIRESGTIFNPAGNRLFPPKARSYHSIFSEEGFDRDLTLEELESTPNILEELREQTVSRYPYVYGTLNDEDQRFLTFSVPRYIDESRTSINFFYDVVYHPNAFFENLLYQISNFRIGVYNAQIDIFAGNQAPLSAQTSFIIIPIHLILTILGIFGIAYIYFRRGGNPKYFKKNKNLSTKLNKA